MLAGWVGGLVVGMVLAAGKRVKRDNSSRRNPPSDDDDDDAAAAAAADDIEAVAAPRRRKKKEAVNQDDESPDDAPKHKCRFCSMKFDKSQALGGHMNRHRLERENEILIKARELVVHSREQRLSLWNIQGSLGPGVLQQGQNTLPNMPLTSGSSRPYFPPNQNWQINQLLSSSQTSISLQSESQGPGGSFYSSQDNTRPQAQGGHQQLRSNPGQHQMAQGQVLRLGADFGSHGQGSYQMERIGPLPPIEGVMLGSNPNNAMTSFQPRTSQGNFQFTDPYATSGLAPFNETQFQPTFQDPSHNYLYDQRPGSSTMGRLDANHDPAGGIFHMPSFQDSTDHIQDDYQGDGNDGHLDAGQASTGLGGSPDDVSSDEKIPR